MSLLENNQIEKLQEISKTLRKVREEKSIRLEEVAIKTNIRLACLKALDAGRFDELPEPVYIQGFIRRYADTIGLDGAALAKTFSPEFTAPQFNSNQHQNVENKPKIHVPLFIPYAVLIVVAAMGLIYVLNPRFSVESLAKQLNLKTPQKQTTAIASASPAAESSPVSVTTQNPTTLPVIVSPTASPNTTSREAIAVTLELQGKSWLEVKADGKTEFIGELNKGERKTWTAKKQLTVRSGNAGAVLISVNNQPAKPMGIPGKIKEVTFTPEVDSQ